METTNKSLLDKAGRYIFELFKTQLSPHYIYHNYQHTMETVARCKNLASAHAEIKEEETEILLLAAWFHDSGYTMAYEGHEEISKEIAKDFLIENEAHEKIDAVLKCIESTQKNYVPSNLLGQIIADANNADIAHPSILAKAELFRSELAKFGVKTFNEAEWNKILLNYLLTSDFHTEEGRKIYGAQRQQNIEELTDRINKLQKKDEKRKKKEAKTKDPRRGIQTMFRTTYRNHINLSAIADDKANMMIRVNSMIISIALTLVGAKFSFLGTSFKQNQVIIYPIITLLFTGLITIIFAILSAKPNITHKMHTTNDLKNSSSSLLFFGNFTSISLDEFKYGMHELVKSKENVYDNMITDLYFLGKVLKRKYFLIKISYITFMTGLIITALVTVYVVIHLKRVD